MLRSQKSVVAVALAGRRLIGGPWFPVQRSRGRASTTHGVTSLEEVECGVDMGYSHQQRGIILHLLNTASEKQLNCAIRPHGMKAADILQYREEHGPFPNLNILCQVLDAKPDTVHKLCQYLLSLRTQKHHQVVAKFLKPEIYLSELQAAQSIVSIVFGMNKLAWAHVDHKKTVRDWQLRECFQFLKTGYVAQMYLETISEVVAQLPQADYYILEQPAVLAQKSSLFPVGLHLRTVEAMLYSLLNPQILQRREHRVYSMQRAAVGKHFGIMLGSSKTSGVDIVERLVEEAPSVPTPRIIIPPELPHQNLHKSRGQRRPEEMCDALLQAITFYELVQ